MSDDYKPRHLSWADVQAGDRVTYKERAGSIVTCVMSEAIRGGLSDGDEINPIIRIERSEYREVLPKCATCGGSGRVGIPGDGTRGANMAGFMGYAVCPDCAPMQHNDEPKAGESSEPRHAAPEPRRWMQANSGTVPWGVHAIEHAEIVTCDLRPMCKPIVPEPPRMQDVAVTDEEEKGPPRDDNSNELDIANEIMRVPWKLLNDGKNTVGSLRVVTAVPVPGAGCDMRYDVFVWEPSMWARPLFEAIVAEHNAAYRARLEGAVAPDNVTPK